MVWTHSGYPSLGQQLTKTGKSNYKHSSLIFQFYKHYQMKGEVSYQMKGEVISF